MFDESDATIGNFSGDVPLGRGGEGGGAGGNLNVYLAIVHELRYFWSFRPHVQFVPPVKESLTARTPLPPQERFRSFRGTNPLPTTEKRNVVYE